MRVRCRGRVLRVVRPAGAARQDRSGTTLADTKIGVAARLEGYEYLPDSDEPTAAFARVAALHPPDDAEKPLASR